MLEGTFEAVWLRLRLFMRRWSLAIRRTRWLRHLAVGLTAVLALVLCLVVTSPPWTLGVDASSGQWTAFGTMLIAIVASGVGIADGVGGVGGTPSPFAKASFG